MTVVNIDMTYVVPENNLIALKCIYNVRMKLITRKGPAGGNPLYSVTGSVEKLREFLTGFYYQGSGFTADEIEREIDGCFPELVLVAA